MQPNRARLICLFAGSKKLIDLLSPQLCAWRIVYATTNKGYSPASPLCAASRACGYDTSDAFVGGHAPIRCRSATILPR